MVQPECICVLQNSLLYSIISVALLVLVCACKLRPISFRFATNKLIQNGFVAAMGVPVVMIILPLFSSVSRFNILNNDTSIKRAYDIPVCRHKCALYYNILAIVFQQSIKVV